MTISINPAITTTASGLFSLTESGLVQGTSLDSPNIRNQLAGGILDPTATLPMWGGVGIYENIPLSTAGATTAVNAFGGYVGRATSVTANAAKSLTGFSVFDQAVAGINSPQSTVPLFSTGQSVNFYRLGSNARIAVQCAPGLVSLDGGLISPQVSWDFAAQQLIPYNAAYPANVITAASWANTAGGQVTFTTTTPHTVAVGEYFTITGMTPSGYNGTFLAITGTTGSTLVAALTTDPGSSTVQGTLVAGGGALNVKVLDVKIGGNMTVTYNAATGFATWNQNGNCAVILI